MSFYLRAGGRGGDATCVVLLTEGLILAGCGYLSLYIDTSSDLGPHALSFTVIFAADTYGSKVHMA